MSDQTHAAAEPITRAINGREVTFARLSFYDRAELLRQWRKEKREELKQRLEECQAPPDQKFVQLQKHDTASVGWFAWAEFFNDYEGMVRILTKSLDKAQQGNGVLAREYTGDDTAILAAAVTATPIGEEKKTGPNSNQGGTSESAQEPETVDKKPKSFGEF